MVTKQLLLSMINIGEADTVNKTRSNVVKAVLPEITSKTGVTLKDGEVKPFALDLEAHHEPIREYFYNSAWRKCVIIEAEMVRRIIGKAMAQGIITLSVHDSIICKKRHQAEVEAIIRDITSFPTETRDFE